MPERSYHHGDLRAALLASAEAILGRDGVSGLTLRGAARHAGVSHAAPVHHFGDLSGLLSVLAASGFRRLRDRLLAAADAAGDQQERLAAMGTAYIGFARREPGLFELMFRSDRLDWSRDELAEAAEAAFALLMGVPADGTGEPGAPLGLAALALTLSRWSMAHGAAILSIDGRIDALAAKEGIDPDALIAALARNFPLSST